MSLILRDEKHPDDVVGHMYELQRVYRNLLADIIDSGRQKGVFRATVNPDLDAGLIMTALSSISSPPWSTRCGGSAPRRPGYFP